MAVTYGFGITEHTESLRDHPLIIALSRPSLLIKFADCKRKGAKD